MSLIYSPIDAAGMARRPTGPHRTVFSKALLSTLAVDEFVALTTTAEREAWAAAHGITRPISALLLTRVRSALRRRKDNIRLGLPDPLR